MKRIIIPALQILTLMAICVSCAGAGPIGSDSEYFYAIEQSGSVCGYAHVVITAPADSGESAVQLVDSLWMKFQALGKSIEGVYRFEYTIDPLSGMYFHHTSFIDQGGTIIGGVMDVKGDSVFIISMPGPDTSIVHIPEGTYFQNTRLYPHLVDFFVTQGLAEKEYPVFSEIDRTINTVLSRNMGFEELDLASHKYQALKVQSQDRRTGVQLTMWIDTSNGLVLKVTNPARTSYLADAGVRDNIAQANMDQHIFSYVDEMISNPWAISHMKIKARLQPIGAWITPEDLNVPGQRFEGTVEDNLIDGVFEINHPRYFGENAPKFPCDYSDIESLQVYLRPTDLIESDNQTLVAKAEEITVGANSTWEAATRLSQWVNDEIGYDLPGGITALKTLETRVGECGSHSNLVAGFCRAVGIPARCVFGCMYVPDHGGAFGQHAWNEVYMGDAGWIPIDATVDEVTYVDCGHVRLGEWKSKAIMYNPEKMEILDYGVGEDTFSDLVKSTGQNYDLYVGKYQGPDKVLTVLLKDNRLALDIPGKMVFELKDPDDNGEWYFALTDQASISFETDASGNSSAIIINSRQYLPRLPSADSVDDGETVTAEFDHLVGDYSIPMANMMFSIKAKDDKLVMVMPGDHEMALASTGDEGKWIGDTGKSKLLVTFDSSEDGSISAMRYSELVHCPKID